MFLKFREKERFYPAVDDIRKKSFIITMQLSSVIRYWLLALDNFWIKCSKQAIALSIIIFNFKTGLLARSYEKMFFNAFDTV